MKPFLPLICTLFIFSCNQKNEKKKVFDKTSVETVTQGGFFPVTDFFKGQITEIRNKGVNPQKLVQVQDHLDSSWIKVEDLENEMAEFLKPVIDTANLKGLFTEKSFLDQTLNAFTLTYDPVKPLPDSFLLQRWDVYIDPQKNSVQRVYLLKKTPQNKIIQLTWKAGKWCRTVVLVTDSKNNTIVERETTIKWDF